MNRRMMAIGMNLGAWVLEPDAYWNVAIDGHRNVTIDGHCNIGVRVVDAWGICPLR